MMLLKDLDIIVLMVHRNIGLEDVEIVSVYEIDKLYFDGIRPNFPSLSLAFSTKELTIAPNDQISVAVPHLICKCASGLLNIGVAIGSPFRACLESI